jgi:hypothetical protein
MKLLQCNHKTLITILLELAQLAKISEFNTESALMLLEEIATNPQLLQSLRKAL